MAKNERWGTNTGPRTVQASNSLDAMKIFGGKTLDAVGGEFDLADEDVQFAYTTLKDGTEVKHMSITHDGVEYIIPFSRGAKADEIPSWTKCMSWMFRTGFMSHKDDDGSPLTDENGAILLADGSDGNASKPYMSFGLPGMNISRRESGLQAEPDEADLGADTTVGKVDKVAEAMKQGPLTTAEKIKAAKAAKAAGVK